MSIYHNATAIVTGAGSGIGLALSKSLIARGAHVWLTDINIDAVKTAAKDFGLNAHPAELDVRNASDFEQVIQRTSAERNGIDFLFNNAGIAVTGEMHLLNARHFDQIIDVNIRGIMNGISAVYPLMVKQGHGHIVNTASFGALLPIPFITLYSMTKHAILGLSKNLHFEAKRYGVKISVLCPTTIDTPILDSEGPVDIPSSWYPNFRRFLKRLGRSPISANVFAEYALKKIESNCSVIVFPPSLRMVILINHLFPGIVAKRIRKALKEELPQK